MRICLLLVLTYTIARGDEGIYRRFYGVNYSVCPSYVKNFKCMTTCKSLGYDVYRMSRKCSCRCYMADSTTPLPYFQWHTNGTTRKPPKTFSPRMYSIVGPYPTTVLFTDGTDSAESTGTADTANTGGETTSGGGETTVHE